MLPQNGLKERYHKVWGRDEVKSLSSPMMRGVWSQEATYWRTQRGERGSIGEINAKQVLTGASLPLLTHMKKERGKYGS
jgi:hypothetical protein